MSSIHYQEVQQAINELLRTKKSVTLANIREQLGHRGSMTTLSKYFHQWKNSKFLDDVPSSELVEPAPDMIMSAVQNVWHQMVGHGQEQITQLEEKFAEQEKALQARLSSVEQQLQDKTKALEKALVEHAHLDQTRRSQEEQIISLVKEQAVFQARVTEIQAASDQYRRSFELFKQDLQETFAQKEKQHQEMLQQVKRHYEQQLDSLKTIMEEERHEHLVIQDALKQEYQQLMQVSQQQKTLTLLHEQQAGLQLQAKQQLDTYTQMMGEVKTMLTAYQERLTQELQPMSFEEKLVSLYPSIRINIGSN